MIPTMAPGTWHTAMAQSIPLPLDMGQPLSGIAPLCLGAAAGIVAAVVIAMVVREALRARARGARPAPGAVVLAGPHRSPRALFTPAFRGRSSAAPNA
jgi:hypothetical protein